jgi:hypothetical protein
MIGGCATNNEDAKKMLLPLTQMSSYILTHFLAHTKIVNENKNSNKKESWLFSSCLFNFLTNKDHVKNIDKINNQSIENNKTILIVDIMNLLFKPNSLKAINILLNKGNTNVKGPAGYNGRSNLVDSFVNLNLDDFIIVMVGHHDTYFVSTYAYNVYLFGMPCFVTDGVIKNNCVNTSIGHNESDDYLITFLYGYYRSLGNDNIQLLTSDKYKWYNEYQDIKYCKLQIDKGIGKIISVDNITNEVIEIINKKRQKTYRLTQDKQINQVNQKNTNL